MATKKSTDYTVKMNEFLADQIVSYIKIRSLHYYVQGPSFFSMHIKLEELYKQTALIMDEVAERLMALDKQPCASLEGALKNTTLEERKEGPIAGKDAAAALQADLETLLEKAKTIASEAEEAEDMGTSDMFTGYTITYGKLIWMLKAYQKKM